MQLLEKPLPVSFSSISVAQLMSLCSTIGILLLSSLCLYKLTTGSLHKFNFVSMMMMILKGFGCRRG